MAIHETTMTLYGDDKKVIGEIDVRITYTIDPGRPARIHYDEFDHPEDPPEIDVSEVEMLAEPKADGWTGYIHAWGWLYDLTSDWAHENISELGEE